MALPNAFPSGLTRRPPVRVAAVPGRHPYVAGLGLDATVLSDAGASAGRWQPSIFMDPAWIAANAGTFDLLHVHFGVEGFGVDRLEAVFAALREAGRPLVHTVHDIEHPQLEHPDGYAEQLDVLVRNADALVTLTPGAAAAVRGRWGRRCAVIAHPAIVAPDGARPVGTRRARAVVGVHLGDLRPNVAGPETAALLSEAVAMQRATGRDVAARVVVRDRARDPRALEAVRAVCERSPDVELVELPRLSDTALAEAVADLDACVLPYRHGTHSGWLELCWDLGVPVAAPPVGFYAEQHPVRGFRRGCAASLAAALALSEPGDRPGTPERRARQQARRAQRRREAPGIAAAHAAVYAEVLGG